MTRLLLLISILLFIVGCSTSSSDDATDSQSQTKPTQQQNTPSTPLFTDITDIAVSNNGDSACVLRAGKIECWTAPWHHSPFDIPTELSGVTKIFGGRYRICAMTESGLRCWGQKGDDPEIIKLPLGLGTVSQYVEDNLQYCAVDEKGVACWNYRKEMYRPSFKDPKQLSIGSLMINNDLHPIGCARNTSSIQCWDLNSKVPIDIGAPPLNSPLEFVIGNEGENPYTLSNTAACAIDADGIKCWSTPEGKKLEVPIGLKNPRQLSMTTAGTCVLTDDGIKCWDSNRQPDANIDLDLYPVLSGLAVYKSYLNPRMLRSSSFYGTYCVLTDEGVECFGSKKINRSWVPEHLYSYIPSGGNPPVETPKSVYCSEAEIPYSCFDFSGKWTNNKDGKTLASIAVDLCQTVSISMVDSIPFSRVVPIDVGAQPTWIGDSFVSACFKEHNLLIESIGADGRIKLSQFSYAADKICHRQYDQTGDQLIGCDLVTKTSSY